MPLVASLLVGFKVDFDVCLHSLARRLLNHATPAYSPSARRLARSDPESNGRADAASRASPPHVDTKENSPTIRPHGSIPAQLASSTAPPTQRSPPKRKRALSSIQRMKRNCSKANQVDRCSRCPLQRPSRIQSILFFHVLLLLLLLSSLTTQPLPNLRNCDFHLRGTVLVFYRYLRHFTDRISLPPDARSAHHTSH